MDSKQFTEYAEKEMAKILEMMKAKNADYTAGGGPFANFEVTEKLGLSDARTGLLIRLVDKVQRIKSFVQKGELKVKGESAQDACNDIIGYALCLKGMLEQSKPAAEPKKLELRIGKRYKRRDGKITGRLKMEPNRNGLYDPDTSRSYLFDGTHARGESEVDLVEELPD